MGHFVLSPREREKRDSRGDEREGQGRKKKMNESEETRGPRVAHLSDIATADMQMLCNIFPILSSQLMKRSSFKQFFILKKKIYGMPVS